jgi:hypothetical protein
MSGAKWGNQVVPCDVFPSAAALATFLRLVVRDTEADWVMLVMDAKVYSHSTRRKVHSIIMMLEAKTGGHWTAHADIVTKD